MKMAKCGFCQTSPYASCIKYLPTFAQHKSPSLVGKYTSTMELMGSQNWIRISSAFAMLRPCALGACRRCGFLATAAQANELVLQEAKVEELLGRKKFELRGVRGFKYQPFGSISMEIVVEMVDGNPSSKGYYIYIYSINDYIYIYDICMLMYIYIYISPYNIYICF